MTNSTELPEDTQRPKTLAAVAQLALGLGSFYDWIREFLDSFYNEQDPHRRAAMLAQAPLELAEPTENAYIAGVAEHLALRYELPVPTWYTHHCVF